MSPSTIFSSNTSFQGHRGARGLLPENTIESCLYCLQLGIPIIEFDVVISQDHKVVLSHEAWFSHKTCSHPNGAPVLPSEEKAPHLLFYQMPYAQIQQFDCGKRGHPDFLQQQAQAAHKPLLSDLIKACDAYTERNNLMPTIYNIEIKTENGAKGDNIYQPEPNVFAQLVHSVIAQTGVQNRVLVQSFDPRLVRAMRNTNSNIATSLLVDNVWGLDWNIKRLGFTPQVYAPYYKLITQKMVNKAHEKGMQIITWTVNDIPTMQKLMHMGVDSIITDYPNLVAQLSKH